MPSSPRSYSSGYVWYVIFLLSVVNVFNYMDRMALSVMAPAVKTDLGLTDTQLGLLGGFAFAIFYAICGIPIARIGDRGSRRDIIAIALATWSIVTALSGAAQSFWQFFLARVGVGVGEGGGVSPALSIICDYVPLERRPGAIAVHTFGLYAGMMVGMMVAGWLSDTVGWRWTFAVLGLPGIALAALVRVSLREPTRGFFDSAQSSQRSASFGATLLTLWNCRTYRTLQVFNVLIGFVQYGLAQWWPSYYVRFWGLSVSSVGLYLGLAIGVGSGIGMLAGGFLANGVAQRNAGVHLVVGAVATALALPAALGSLFVPSARDSILLVSLTALLWSVSIGPMTSAMISVTMPRMRAMAAAIAIFFVSVLGFGLGPLCVGLLSDVLTPTLGAEALRYALLIPTCLLPFMAIALYAAAKTLPNDLKAVGANAEDD